MNKITRRAATSTALNIYVNEAKKLLTDQGYEIVRVDIRNKKWFESGWSFELFADIYFKPASIERNI